MHFVLRPTQKHFFQKKVDLPETPKEFAPAVKLRLSALSMHLPMTSDLASGAAFLKEKDANSKSVRSVPVLLRAHQ
jgi:hypothetical protein